MLPERSHWIALGAVGGAVVVQGALDVAAGSPRARTAVFILSGLLLVGSGSVGFVRSPEALAGSNSLLVRAVTVAGALLYVSFTFLRVMQ